MNSIDIIKGSDFKKIEELFKENKPAFAVEQADAIKEFKVAEHDIFDTTIRPPKKIIKGSGEVGADGKEETTITYIEPARIGMPFQQLIVDRRVGFMLTIPVKTEPTFEKETDKEKNLVKLVDRIQNNNKMDYRNKEIARRWMSEMECAEIWYFVKTEEAKPKLTLKCNIWSPDLGDNLYPLFDSTGNLIAFARGYKLKEEKEGKDKKEDIEHFDVYTSEFEYKYINKGNAWTLDQEVQSMTFDGLKAINPIPNLIKKIMIVYHSQSKPEWSDQGSMISRLETSFSNHADMNDYFGSPILAVMGEITGFAQKGEQGKILQLADEAKANYLALNSPPESIKMEQENLENAIYKFSQTPDISFKAMAGMGTIAQFTMKAFFMDAHMAVSKKEEVFGIGLQRRLNIIKAAIGLVIDTSLSNEAKVVQLKPVLTPYLPQNTTEMIENLTVAKSGGIISTETAIEQNPMIEDKEAELERIKNDKTEELAGEV